MEMMKNNTGLACLGFFVLALALIVVSAGLNGWVVSVMWGWFVVPTFGLPSLTVLQAVGLCLVLGMLIRNASSDNSEKDKTERWVSAVAYAVGTPLFTLFVGWIVKGLM
jgi:hypothetical protein